MYILSCINEDIRHNGKKKKTTDDNVGIISVERVTSAHTRPIRFEIFTSFYSEFSQSCVSAQGYI